MMTLDEAVKKVRLWMKRLWRGEKEMGQYCKAPAFSGRAGEYADTDRRYHRYTGGTCGEKSSGCHVRG